MSVLCLIGGLIIGFGLGSVFTYWRMMRKWKNLWPTGLNREDWGAPENSRTTKEE